MFLQIFLGIIVLIIAVPSALALENNTEYAMEGEEIFVIFELENNELATIDGGMLVDDSWQFFDMENIKFIRGSDDFSDVRLFGTTENGHNFYLKWNQDETDVLLMGKIWTEDGKFRIIENLSIEKLFYDNEGM